MSGNSAGLSVLNGGKASDPGSEGPEIRLGVGADIEKGKVVVQFSMTGKDGFSVVLYYDPLEAERLATSLVKSADAVAKKADGIFAPPSGLLLK